MKTYDNVKQLSDYLVQHGIKPSFQRVKILQRLVGKKDHPTVNQIYSDLIMQIPSLSKTTVYNTLNLFIRNKVARAVNTDTNEARYDLITSSHGHFLCNKCGNIYDFDIQGSMNFDFLQEQGNQIQSLDITIKGLCKNCLKK